MQGTFDVGRLLASARASASGRPTKTLWVGDFTRFTPRYFTACSEISEGSAGLRPAAKRVTDPRSRPFEHFTRRHRFILCSCGQEQCRLVRYGVGNRSGI